MSSHALVPSLLLKDFVTMPQRQKGEEQQEWGG